MDLSDKYMRRVMSMPPVLIGVAVTDINKIKIILVSSLPTGSVSAMDYA